MIIGKKYEIVSKIGVGTFGTIYKGKNIRTGELVAIKIEPVSNETRLLKNETKIYQYLSSFKYVGIPSVKWFGMDEENYYMVLNLLGNSLLQVKNHYKKIPLNNVIKIGVQIIERLKFIHSKGLIHRDIKPENFLFGYLHDDTNRIYIIDFGFCKRYINDDGLHNEIKKINKIIGTSQYVSINVHNLIEPSRRDDIESVIYILMLLYYGNLDWEYETNDEKIKYIKTNILQMRPDLEELFVKMIQYVRLLEYKEEPLYNYLIELCKTYYN